MCEQGVLPFCPNIQPRAHARLTGLTKLFHLTRCLRMREGAYAGAKGSALVIVKRVRQACARLDIRTFSSGRAARAKCSLAGLTTLVKATRLPD